MEVAGGSLELHQSSSLMLVAVENDFPNGFVVIVIIDQRSKELVDHSSLHAMSLAGHSALLEMLDASLDEIRAALPLELVSARIKELDSAAGVIKNLFALRGHRPHLHLGIFVGPVRGGGDSEELLAALCNERLGDYHIANIETTVFPLRLVVLHQIFTQCLGNIGVQRLCHN